MPSDELPPIHTWWPHLSIPARNAVLEDPEAPLSPLVARDIAAITGTAPAAGACLSDDDRQFVREQTETVD
ncbi:hypothetical protein PU630_02730 [Microbacterium horticulturae]|uniref:Uncharacterized protein n=1 Tax=Microbacterium horticulturae TaxID=3028316 RepID=A0ABY8BZU5_9MICO|nr:hypothetical protein [Microbacterium sp. KACC 23027]WEG09500.1 hypothetical protein PU630_02730 [Microbacterium sp. KACC 23027]